MIDYGKVLSKTVVDTPKSGIRKFFDLMSSMTDVVGLTVGEPDFQTPWHIREAGIMSLEKGKTYYTANAGMMDLRCEINSYMTRRFGVSYKPESEVIVTVGGSEAIDIALRSVIEAGDEVIVLGGGAADRFSDAADKIDARYRRMEIEKWTAVKVKFKK